MRRSVVSAKTSTRIQRPKSFQVKTQTPKPSHVEMPSRVEMKYAPGYTGKPINEVYTPSLKVKKK